MTASPDLSKPGNNPPTDCSDRCDADAGYQRHRWYDEEPCGRSKRAHAAHNAQRRRELFPPEPRRVPAHGTRARYERERKAFKAGIGPEPCEMCTLANTARTRAARDADHAETAARLGWPTQAEA